MLIFANVTENKCINEWHPLVKGNNLGWWSGVVVSALALINEVNQRRAG